MQIKGGKKGKEREGLRDKENDREKVKVRKREKGRKIWIHARYLRWRKHYMDN